MQKSTSESKAASHSASSGSKTMADLMNKAAKTPFVSLHKGDMLEGTITKLTRSEVLIDIDAKTEAVVLEKEKSILDKILSSYKLGDKVSVQVLNPESDFGYPVVSLRRSIGNITWDRLTRLKKDQKPVEVILDMATKGGFLVTTLDGISGFLPNSHTSSLENPQGLIGKKIKVVVLESNRELNKIIFSQKQVMNASDFQQLIKNLKTGQKIDAVVSNVTAFGVFLSIPAGDSKVAEGFIHISETSWENVENISQSFKIGDRIEGIVTGFDKDSRRVNVSIKRLSVDPFEKKLDEYTVDKKIKATVEKVIATGVLLKIDEGITGIIKKDKIPVRTTYKEGQVVDVVVSAVDKKRHRLEVSPVLLDKPIGYR
jgi:small subunit ribosomal protein S1